MIKAKPEQIRLIMKINKINLTQLANEIGVTRQAIHNALMGKPVGEKLIGGLIQYSGWDFSDIFYIEKSTLKSILTNSSSNSPETSQDESLSSETGKHIHQKKEPVL